MRKIFSELTMLIMASHILSCNGFWWRTTTEATPLLRQMPISYFRTYTYHQPIGYPGSLFQAPSYNQYALPSRFSGWSQFPSASDGVSVLSNYKQEPTTTSTTTTTTTPSTTYPPQTTPTTTRAPPIEPILFSSSSSSSTQMPLLQPSHQLPINLPSPVPGQKYSLSSSYVSSSGHHYLESHPPAAQYLTSGPMRASAFLTPDYPNQYYYSNTAENNPMSLQQPMSPAQQNGKTIPPNQYHRQQIRYVPCMCPITVSVSNEFAESRSAPSNDVDADNEMSLPDTQDDIKSKNFEDIDVSS